VAQTLTLTNSVEGQTSALAPSHPALPASTTFLQNKVLSGFVFGLAGLVGLVLLTVTATHFIRRKRYKELLVAAEKFVPTSAAEHDSFYENHSQDRLPPWP
jgi:hypothetical protein